MADVSYVRTIPAYAVAYGVLYQGCILLWFKLTHLLEN